VLLIILPNSVHTGNLQFLAIFHNLAANEHNFFSKTSKTSINTSKQSRLFLILVGFSAFFLIIQLPLIADCYGLFI